MKRFLTLSLLIAAMFSFQPELHAQAPEADKSILDLSFLRVKGEDGSNNPVVRLMYSRPAKNGRNIFGDLVKMDKVWRLGANEATEMMVFSEITLGGTKVDAGRYSLFAIPSADKWTLIVSNQLDVWGAFSYSEDHDVARIEVGNVAAQEASTELFSMYFSKDGDLNIEWDTTKVTVPVAVSH